MVYESLQILAGKALNGMPSMVAFAGALGIIGVWIGGLIGIFSYWPPFQDLEFDLLIGALLPQHLGDIILSNRYKNPNKKKNGKKKIKDEKSHKNNSTVRKTHTKQEKKWIEDKKPIDKISKATKCEKFSQRR